MRVLLGIGTVLFLVTLSVCMLSRENPTPTPKYNSIKYPANNSTFSHLIIVPGHAIHRCKSRKALVSNEENCWTLLPYQRGQVGCFLEHLNKAVELAAQDPTAMLILSGGQTRQTAGPRSESSSYLDALELLNHPNLPSILSRIYTEDYARDSLQNLLFSLCRYQQITAHSQITAKSLGKITIIGFPFKSKRFRELHAPIVLQKELEFVEFEYLSVGCEGVREGEELDDAYPVFKNDPMGCGKELMGKRLLRNPFSQVHPYHACPHPLIRDSCHAHI